MKFKVSYMLILLMALTSVSGFSAEPEKSGSAGPESPGLLDPIAKKVKSSTNYKIQAGDKLLIKIYPEDPYVHGGEMEVTPEGNVTLPLLGKINVVGRTVNEASSGIQTMIDRDYLVNPEVVIQVLGFKEQSFVVLGQVRKPGTYQFPAGNKKFTFLQAISLAGGFSEVANIKKVRIIRADGGQRKIIRMNAEKIISGEDPDVELVSGDVINVSESLF